MYDIHENFSLFLSGSCRLQCRGGCLSQSWKNKCDDVSLSSVQFDQCYWQCDRCFCFSSRGSRCCMAVLPCPCFSAVTITFLCFREKNRVVYRGKWIFRWHGSLMKSILNVAIPNGVENGIFQLVKVALSSIVALFGTYQIAANGVAQSIWSLAALAGVAMGPVFITVIGQCMGTGNTEAAEYHFKKLTKLTLFVSAVWNLLVFILTPVFLHFYSLSPDTKRLVVWLVLIHNVFNAAFYPFSGALSNGLRTAGDVKFTMYVSVVSTVAVRLLLSYLLGITLQMGVIGIALAMVCDWAVRAVLFIWRERTGKWKTFQVINKS